MSLSKIEWTDRTWNPVRGCSRVSPGCENCYAERRAARFSGEGLPFEGFAKRTKAGPRWTRKVELMHHKLAEPLSWTKPQRVFVNSMSDLFHEELSFEEIAAVFAVMRECPGLTFQVLTKRPRRMREWFRWVDRATWRESDPSVGYVASQDEMLFHHLEERLDGAALEKWANAVRPADPKRYTWPLPNVWLGVSAEDQARADERIPLLLETPAAVRFVSYEPALELVDFRPYFPREVELSQVSSAFREGIDWLILGGESGPGARPCDVTGWPEIIQQCREAGTAVFVKQLGARSRLVNLPPRTVHEYSDEDFEAEFGLDLKDPKGGNPAEWPKSLRVREFPEAKP